MKRIIASALAASLALMVLAAPSMAAPKKTAPKHAKVMTLKCPKCGMMMSTHKSAMLNTPMKVKGVTYYCCKMCAGKAGGPKKSM